MGNTLNAQSDTYSTPLDSPLFAIHKSTIVEIVLPGIASGNNAPSLQFIDQPYLRDKKIMGVQVFNSNDISVTPQGYTPPTPAQAAKSFLTLYSNTQDSPDSEGLWLQLIPYNRLHLIQNSNGDPFARQMYCMAGQIVSWDKCYWTFGSALANTDPVSYIMEVYFQD